MIVYLSSNENAMKFEFLDDEKVVNRQVKSEMTGEQLLNFVKTDLRNLDINLLIIDLGIMKDSQDENILAALSTYQILFTESKILIFHEPETVIQEELSGYAVEESQAEKAVLMMLSDGDASTGQKEDMDASSECDENETVQVENVMETVQTVMKKEKTEESIMDFTAIAIKTHDGIPLKRRIKRLCSAENMIQDELQKEQHMPNIVKLPNQEKDKLKILKHQWNCNNLMVAVIGSERRTGTTTAAFHIVEWLNRAGAKVSYTEANNHFHLRKIAEKENFKENFNAEKRYFSGHGIEYYENTEFDQESGRNFIILDLGNFQENPDWVIQIMDQVADIVILTAGGKTYEQESLEKAVDSISIIGKPGAIIFNFLQAQEFVEQKNKLNGKGFTLINSKYEPDLLKPIDVSEIFECYKSS